MSNPRTLDPSLPDTHEAIAMEGYPAQHERTFPLRDDPAVPEEVQHLHDSRSSADPELPKYTERDQRPQSQPEKLFRPRYLLAMAFLYCCLTIIPWVIICVQNKRPITARTYDYRSGYYSYRDHLRKEMERNVRWFDAMRVFLSIAHTLVMPITLAVCVGSAVIYNQSLGQHHRRNMQHLCVLVDQGWPGIAVRFGGFRLKGAYFMFFAIFLHALGLLVSPLQQSYIGQESFKFQSSTSTAMRVSDSENLFEDTYEFSEIDIDRLRSELASVSYSDYQPYLWRKELDCGDAYSLKISSQSCSTTDSTFEDISSIPQPYTAQLPSGFQTGLVRQFVPRINSSVSYSNITQSTSSFESCISASTSYYIEHSYNKTQLTVQVCMPDALQSPWKPTGDRQDITERLFLNIHSNESIYVFPYSIPAKTTFELVVNSTLGYFELPNYYNKGDAGPLLTKDPRFDCKGDNSDGQCLLDIQKSKRSFEFNATDGSLGIFRVASPGPLAIVARALFGEGSYITTQVPQNRTAPRFMNFSSASCEVTPLGLLISYSSSCDSLDKEIDEDDVYDNVASWLSRTFYQDIASQYESSPTQNALHASVILASQIWLASPSPAGRTIEYDMGIDSVRPKISTTGVVVISVILGIYLLLLLGLALSTCFTPT